MSYQYDKYLSNHKANVKKGFHWVEDILDQIKNKLEGEKIQ